MTYFPARNAAGRCATRARHAALVLAACLLGGCGDPTAVEFAPAVPPPGAVSVAAARAKPAQGPWFVDRAREFGVDIVTRCGSPDKPSILHSLGSGVGLLDFDNDGDLDILVGPGSEVKGGKVVAAGGPWLLRNDGPGRWVDVSEKSGLKWTGWAQGIAVADYDADGDLDVFFAQHGPDALWRNQGDGTFKDVTKAAGLGDDNYWGVAATWGDYDGNGWLDLYVSNYVQVDPIHPPPLHDHPGGIKVFPGPGMLKGEPDRLWRNRGDGTFGDVTREAGLDQPDGKGMANVFADLDEDGQIDLFVTNDAQANHLFRASPGGRFREAAQEAGVAVSDLGAPEGSMGVEVADLDGDGHLDLIYTNFRHEGTRYCRSLGNGQYADTSNASRISLLTIAYVGWGLIVSDFDEDGLPDLFQANGHFYPNTMDSEYAQPPVFLRQAGPLAFEDATASWGPDLSSLRSGRSCASGDLDGDGDVDIVMSTIDGPLRIMINEGTRAGSSINVRLLGRAPNRDTVGARVEVTAGGRTQVAVARRGGGFMAASDNTLHFGLGAAEKVDRVVVRWPDGRVDRHESIPANVVLTLDQAKSSQQSRPYPTRAHAEISKR